ncbi:hypothetical protein AGR7C_Lc100052 [Agrobacterium deltaense Zutra 3/1]|uniref:ParB-like N-terminal domain-containing protein n=1 Tax=Agrobacterium deltaense Zutra 3/1 TaxID=1183427 RepID=A0A1S7QRE9_9HYPH|nr:ParB N-terminal domain-containing protein [Agrobacterium deltaense]CUX40661.1 hypothetical protein AGR7C_Lc100052 [Agrobacterium deltaense Zutra 3/1]
MTFPYQVMPSLSAEDLESLEKSIKANGVLVAVEYDELDNIIDGHHRVAICQKLGIRDWPKSIRSNLSEDQKRALARQLNIARRHLSTNQKRMIIAQHLSENPSSSDRLIALALGVDHKTVGSERKRLVRSGSLPMTGKIIGQNGKEQPYHRSRHKCPWRDLKLNFIASAGDIAWYELPAILRDLQQDISILSALHAHCIPDDEQLLLRDLVSVAVAAEIFEKNKTPSKKDGGAA